MGAKRVYEASVPGDIQTLWLQTMYEAYATRRQAYFSTLRRNSCDPSSTKFPDFQQRYQNPGEKIIASCIARNYFVKEKLYNNRMYQMSAVGGLVVTTLLKSRQILAFGLIRGG